jgi:hypothetical protein
MKFNWRQETPSLTPPRRRLSIEILSVGADIAAMPLLDPRTPREIIDAINSE